VRDWEEPHISFRSLVQIHGVYLRPSIRQCFKYTDQFVSTLWGLLKKKGLKIFGTQTGKNSKQDIEHYITNRFTNIATKKFVCLWRNSPPSGQGLFIHEISRWHTTTHLQSVGFLWTSELLVAETSTCQHTTLTT